MHYLVYQSIVHHSLEAAMADKLCVLLLRFDVDGAY
jgi:hypothetical protein